MRKIITVILLSTMLCIPAFSESRIKILYGKNEIACDVSPTLVNDRTMVPLRAIFEAIGATVEYDDLSRKITASTSDTTVVLHVDSDKMLVNNREITLDSPAFETNGRTLIPLRVCSESFGLKVEWFDKARTVKIKKGEWLLTERSYDTGSGSIYKYDENGNLIEEIHAHTTIQYTYNDLGNELSRTVNGGGGTYNEYDIYGNLTSTRDALSFSRKEYTYDNNHRMITEKHYSKTSPNPSVSVVYEYDEEGKLLKKISNEYEEVYAYNAKGNLLSIVGADGARTDFQYDENENLLSKISSNGIWFRYTYDEKGNKLTEEDNRGVISKYTYDEHGNILTYENTTGYWEKNTYDDNNQNITHETDAGITTHTYDEHGNRIQSERNGEKTYYKYEYFER